MKLSEEYAVIRGIKEVNGQPMFNENIKPKIILLEDNIAELKRTLKGERKVAKHHASVINVARRLCNEGDEQIATLKREMTEAKDYITQYLDEDHPFHTEDITVLAFAEAILRDALLTAEEQGAEP